MAKLAELGIDFKAVTDKLEADGVASSSSPGIPSLLTSRLASTASTAELLA